MSTHQIVLTSDIAQFAFSGILSRLDPAYVTAGHADAHLLALDETETVQARASLWWTRGSALLDERVGCIGHYAANTRTAAAALLDDALAKLRAKGCTMAVAPLDGNTFRNYRFVIQRTIDGVTHPPFFLEPNNPQSWPDDLRSAGFTPMAEYVSSIATLHGEDKRLAAATANAAVNGVRVRPLDPAQFDQELTNLFPVIMEAFRANLLFSPISEEEFKNQYAPMRALLQPELMLLAERDDKLVGFLFALPDLTQAQRGEEVDTVIFKTLAVLPELSGMGIGSLLAAQAHTNAHTLGYRQVIHALMHRDNRSQRISSYNARPMRRYALFAQPLLTRA